MQRSSQADENKIPENGELAFVSDRSRSYMIACTGPTIDVDKLISWVAAIGADNHGAAI